MNMTIPEKVSWRKYITSDILSDYGKTASKRLLKTIENSAQDDITYTISDLTTELIAWFTPLYTEIISTKNSPVIFDIENTTKNTDEKTYKMLVITEHGMRIGGLIFSITDMSINIAYKVFANDWEQSTLPAGPSLYADYLITSYAQSLQKEFISHGKDRNIYGKHSSIGLAVFKIALGYKPYLPKEVSFINFNPLELAVDSLYFEKDTKDDVPLVGHIFVTNVTKSTWERLESYADRVKTIWHTR